MGELHVWGLTDIDVLVKGVTLQRAGEALETVALRNHVNLKLLAAWDGTEVVRQEIPAGRRFGLRPQPGWSALEAYFVLDGEALFQEGDRKVTVGRGDIITAAPVEEACLLTAVTDLVLLYVSSQPGFHLISEFGRVLTEMTVSVEEKDGYTQEHCRRIRDLSMAVGQKLGLGQTQIYNLLHGAFLHDLGKVGVPASVLQKPSGLTPEEWVVMKQHTVIGSQMLLNTAFASAAYILEQHHERLDGSGYPKGLQGDQISIEAQIVAVVDSYDAMTTDRVYRPGMPHEAAVAELRKGAGRLYRSEVVEAFVEVLDNLA